MKIKTDDQAPVVKCVGADVVLSSRPKASMLNLLDAVAEFEPGFVMERAQPAQADVREFERVPGLRVESCSKRKKQLNK